MLAQSFKSADELGITEPQCDALRKTLVLLETGKLVHVPYSEKQNSFSYVFTGHFNMAEWSSATSCGTVACIGGTAELLGGVGLRNYYGPKYAALNELFMGHSLPPAVKLSDITPSQAATALRSYLTTGDAKWHEAVA